MTTQLVSNIKNKVLVLYGKIPKPFMYLVLAIFVLLLFWWSLDKYSEWRVNRKIAEYTKLKNELEDRNKKLQEANIILESEKTKLNDDKIKVDKVIQELSSQLADKKSQIVYIDRKINNAKEQYKKELDSINASTPIDERLRRLCESRKELGFEGGICK